MGLRNAILSIVSGVLFAVSWWMFIAGVAYADQQPGEDAGPGWLYISGIFGTVGLFLMSNLPTTVYSGSGWSGDVQFYQKLILAFSGMLHVAGIICVSWLYAERPETRVYAYQKRRGAFAIIQGILLLLVSLIWNFGYKDEFYV